MDYDIEWLKESCSRLQKFRIKLSHSCCHCRSNVCRYSINAADGTIASTQKKQTKTQGTIKENSCEQKVKNGEFTQLNPRIWEKAFSQFVAIASHVYSFHKSERNTGKAVQSLLGLASMNINKF